MFLLVFWYQHLPTTAIHLPRQGPRECTIVWTHLNASIHLDVLIWGKKKCTETEKTPILLPMGDSSHLSAWSYTEIYSSFAEQ